MHTNANDRPVRQSQVGDLGFRPERRLGEHGVSDHPIGQHDGGLMAPGLAMGDDVINKGWRQRYSSFLKNRRRDTFTPPLSKTEI